MAKPNYSLRDIFAWHFLFFFAKKPERNSDDILISLLEVDENVPRKFSVLSGGKKLS